MAELSPLRRRMIEDMTVRNLSPATQRSYIYAVAKFSQYFGCSPDRLDMEAVRAYQVQLVAQGISWPALNQTVCALRFFYGVTLGRSELPERIPYAREPRKLPLVLSADEVVRFLEAVPGLKSRTALTTAYAAGLRASETARLRYQDVERHLEPYYQCTDAVVRHAGKLCQSVRGRPIDEAVSALLLDTVAPAAIEMALAVQEEIAHRIEEAEGLRRSQLERTRYEAELARRRYLKVDPENRLVADALEADWNDRLRHLDALQREHERQRAADRGLLSEAARGRILSLAKEFRRVWDDPRTAPIERKRIVALLIEDVTLVKSDRIAIHVRFRGGKTTSLAIDKPKPITLIRKTLPEVVRAVDELLETCTDRQAAARLNDLGHRNWKGQAFTLKKVELIRRAYRLKSRFERLRERGMLTGDELAKQLGVCTTTVHQWGRAGLLRRHLYGNNYRCLYEPVRDVVVIKGAGGRYGSRSPALIAAPSTGQGAI